MKWHYKTVRVTGDRPLTMPDGPVDAESLANLLNILGDEGWELVQIVSTGQWLGRGGEVIAILKRAEGA